MKLPGLTLRNGDYVLLKDIPVLAIPEWREAVAQSTKEGSRCLALFGKPDKNCVRLFTLLGDDATGLSVLCADVEDTYPSLTPLCPQAHYFEREIYEQWSIKPEGHHWLKPIRFQRAYRDDGKTEKGDFSTLEPLSPGITEFFQIQGKEVHEVAVGPVHAGVIEPGHFRFQCHGEDVLHLEISLGYQHRGVEKALIGGPNKKTIHYMETCAGDTSIGHAMAYAHLMESLGGAQVPEGAHTIRAIALELERLANHTGDLGALAGDVGFLPTASYCGRIRGDFLNLTAEICGSRLGRGLVRPGGVQFGIDQPLWGRLCEKLKKAHYDVKQAADLLWDTPSVLGRFEGVGAIHESTCKDLGLVGPAARACGLKRDVRQNYPFGHYAKKPFQCVVAAKGDVYSRAYVRWLEIDQSVQLILEQKESPNTHLTSPLKRLRENALAVSLVEGWRGEICHIAMTDGDGRFSRYKVVDPSFHNWMGLAFAMRNQQISDFPLCNKSFNLSYCGHDL